jgi:hypothetical protein
MLIITTERLKNAAAPYNLQALADAHKSRDMDKVYIETVESIYTRYQVNSCPEWATFTTYTTKGGATITTPNFNGLKIRECVRDYYLHKGVDYVLLAGDDDYNWKSGMVFAPPPTFAPLLRDSNKMDQNEVPTFQLYLYSLIPIDYVVERGGSELYDVTTASDLPYGCLDNEGILIFPSNSMTLPILKANSYFPDLYSEVSVGRAPVSDENDLRNFVKKTISYLQAPSDQYNKVLMAGEYLGFGGVDKQL